MGGRTGKFIGNRISEHYPGADRRSEQIMNFLINSQPEVMQPIVRAKFAPYSHLNPTTHLGAMSGRRRSDTIVQWTVALSGPLFFAGEYDA